MMTCEDPSTVERTLITVSLLVAGASALVNGVMLAFTYHRAMHTPRSATKAAVLFALGIAFVLSIAALAATRLTEIRLGHDQLTIGATSVYAWCLIAVVSLSITLVMLTPERLWRDYVRDDQR